MSSSGVSIEIASDRMKAVLKATAGAADQVTLDGLRALAKSNGVAYTAEVEAALEAFVKDYGDGSADHESVIAAATAPTHGMDGAVNWDPKLNLDGKGEVTAECTVDHYEGQAFPRVASGDVIGHLRRATTGADGIDVLGKSIEACSGETIALHFDGKTVEVSDDGAITALTDGVVVLTDTEVRISDALEIAGDVDFNTGHVEFDGSVSVSGGVKPDFKIEAEGELRVGKMIEAAIIVTGGDFVCNSGFVGQHQGTMDIGRNADVKYLDKVSGVVKGDLTVEKEIVDCDFKIGGDLNCENGAILGGEIAVTGSLKIGVLGSDAWTETTVVLGDVPLLVGDRKELVSTINKLKDKRAKITAKEDMIRTRQRLSPGEKEMLTEIAFEGSAVDREMSQASAKLAEIDTLIQSTARVDVHVGKVIHPKVKLILGQTVVLFKEEVQGPMWLGWDDNQRLTVRNERQGARPLAETATIYQQNMAA